MSIKKRIILSSIAVIVLGLTGCQSVSTIDVTENNQTITIPKSPNKIVVMNYGALDTLDALGQGQRVVATSLSSLPSYLSQYKQANIIDTGNMKEPDMAKIKASQPELIIIGGRQNRLANELTKIAPVINLDADMTNYLQSVNNHIALLGKITQTEPLAERYIQSIEKKVNESQLITAASDKKAIIVLHNDGNVMLMNHGPNAALIYDVLNVKRAVLATDNTMKSNERPKPTLIDNRYIAKHKPDIIYVIDRSKAIGNKGIDNNYFDAAVLNKSGTKIVYLSADIWYLSGGGIESIERQIDEVISPLK